MMFMVFSGETCGFHCVRGHSWNGVLLLTLLFLGIGVLSLLLRLVIPAFPSESQTAQWAKQGQTH